MVRRNVHRSRPTSGSPSHWLSKDIDVHARERFRHRVVGENHREEQLMMGRFLNMGDEVSAEMLG